MIATKIASCLSRSRRDASDAAPSATTPFRDACRDGRACPEERKKRKEKEREWSEKRDNVFSLPSLLLSLSFFFFESEEEEERRRK